jgi:hypothetical protein
LYHLRVYHVASVRLAHTSAEGMWTTPAEAEDVPVDGGGVAADPARAQVKNATAPSRQSPVLLGPRARLRRAHHVPPGFCWHQHFRTAHAFASRNPPQNPTTASAAAIRHRNRCRWSPATGESPSLLARAACSRPTCLPASVPRCGCLGRLRLIWLPGVGCTLAGVSPASRKWTPGRRSPTRRRRRGRHGPR